MERPGDWSVEDIELMLRKVTRDNFPKVGDILEFSRLGGDRYGWTFKSVLRGSIKLTPAISVGAGATFQQTLKLSGVTSNYVVTGGAVGDERLIFTFKPETDQVKMSIFNPTGGAIQIPTDTVLNLIAFGV